MKTASRAIPGAGISRSSPFSGGKVRYRLVFLAPLLALWLGFPLSAEVEAEFSFSIEPGSETWVSIPVHPATAFAGEVLEVVGRTITFTQRFCEPDCENVSAYDVVSLSDRILVTSGGMPAFAHQSCGTTTARCLLMLIRISMESFRATRFK